MSVNGQKKPPAPKWFMTVWLILFGSIFASFVIGAISQRVGWAPGTWMFLAPFVLFPTLFIYTFVIGIISLFKYRPHSSGTSMPKGQSAWDAPANKTKIPVAPPEPGVSLGTSTAAASAADRQVRAGQGANFTAPRKKSLPSAIYIPFLFSLAGMGLIFLGGGAGSADGPSGSAAAPPLTLIGVAMFVGGIGWLMVRAMLPNKQVRAYGKKYAKRVDLAAARSRAFEEPLRGRAASQFGGTGPWNEAMWEKYAAALLGREMEMREYAKRRDGEYATVLDGRDEDVINPNMLHSMASGLWQVRNVVVLPDRDTGDYPVQVADLNSLTEVRVNKAPSPGLFPSTFAETWFPSDHQLVVYPDKVNIANEWRTVGKPVTPLEPHLDKLYDVRATDDFWARVVLNVNVMERLVNLHPVVLLIDRGKITLHRPGGWVEEDELTQFTETVQRIARSAKSAEA